MRLRMVISSFVVLLVLVSTAVAGDTGLVRLKSEHSVATTLDRLSAALTEKGLTVFTRINHSEGAKKVGASLRPTELLIFGNPKAGTPLMNCAQSVAIDLPQKALAWEDENGQVWIGYNDPSYLAQRHGLGDCNGMVAKVSKILSTFIQAAAAP